MNGKQSTAVFPLKPTELHNHTISAHFGTVLSKLNIRGIKVFFFIRYQIRSENSSND